MTLTLAKQVIHKTDTPYRINLVAFYTEINIAKYLPRVLHDKEFLDR